MISVEIKTAGPGLEQIAAALAGPVRDKFLQLISDVAFETMRELAPVRTGALRDSIQKFETEDGVKVGPTAPYAVFVEEGTAPHMIYPVNARCLAFMAGGRMVFTAYVSHPGTKPQPFVRYAAEEAQRRAPDLWQQAFEES